MRHGRYRRGGRLALGMGTSRLRSLRAQLSQSGGGEPRLRTQPEASGWQNLAVGRSGHGDHTCYPFPRLQCDSSNFWKSRVYDVAELRFQPSSCFQGHFIQTFKLPQTTKSKLNNELQPTIEYLSALRTNIHTLYIGKNAPVV